MSVKKVVQIGALSSVVMLLAACGTTKNYSAAVNTWQGAPVSALVRDWGHPTHIQALSDGSRLYVYRVVERQAVHKSFAPPSGFVRLSPQNVNTVAMGHPSINMNQHDETFWCETSFEVSKNNVIVDTRFKGNNCVATQHGVNRYAFAN